MPLTIAQREALQYAQDRHFAPDHICVMANAFQRTGTTGPQRPVPFDLLIVKHDGLTYIQPKGRP